MPVAAPVLTQLVAALRDLPSQQADAARFVLRHPFDAATQPMRSLALRAGHVPATFTRLAQSLGLSGWEALRAQLIEDTRADIGSRHAPFSNRVLPDGDAGQALGAMLEADAKAVGSLDAAAIDSATALLAEAPHVHVAGFRSCHAPAMLFHYLYRLFRPDVTLISGHGGVLDLELGALRPGDALVLLGFDPYSRDGLLCARAAGAAGTRVVAVVDAPQAPFAEGAAAVLTFGLVAPGFFPSLTACTALVQALAFALYARSGAAGRTRLRESEARIAAHTAYLRLDGAGE